MIRKLLTVTSFALVLAACSDEEDKAAKTEAPAQPAASQVDTQKAEEAAAKAKLEADAKAEAELKAKAEREARIKLEAEEKVRAEMEAEKEAAEQAAAEELARPKTEAELEAEKVQKTIEDVGNAVNAVGELLKKPN